MGLAASGLWAGGDRAHMVSGHYCAIDGIFRLLLPSCYYLQLCCGSQLVKVAEFQSNKNLTDSKQPSYHQLTPHACCQLSPTIACLLLPSSAIPTVDVLRPLSTCHCHPLPLYAAAANASAYCCPVNALPPPKAAAQVPT